MTSMDFSSHVILQILEKTTWVWCLYYPLLRLVKYLNLGQWYWPHRPLRINDGKSGKESQSRHKWIGPKSPRKPGCRIQRSRVRWRIQHNLTERWGSLWFSCSFLLKPYFYDLLFIEICEHLIFVSTCSFLTYFRFVVVMCWSAKTSQATQNQCWWEWERIP